MLLVNRLGRRYRALAVTLLAVSLGFALVEILVRHVVGFPPRPQGRLIVVNDGSGVYDRLLWEAPYTRFWNVEGGNVIVRYNNLGLPGCDVQPSPDSRYVFVLGSSYVEASQLPGDSIATTVLQHILSGQYPRYQVLNLGISGSDAYTSWFRARYFADRFPPSGLILVIDEFHGEWLKNHRHPLSFSLVPSFGTDAPLALPARLFRWMREKSAFVNLVGEALRSAKREEGIAAPQETGAKVPETVPEDLKLCLENYAREFGTRFAVVSMVPRHEGGEDLAKCCQSLDIPFVDAPGVGDPENRFQHWGHLNAKGNRELGRALYEAFQRTLGHPESSSISATPGG